MIASNGQTARWGNHGSLAGSMPLAWEMTRFTTAAGEGNSTFAQTPSVRSREVPRIVPSPWVMNRSMPGVGTATTSGVNGSEGMSASRCDSPSKRAPVRSLRCTYRPTICLPGFVPATVVGGYDIWRVECCDGGSLARCRPGCPRRAGAVQLGRSGSGDHPRVPAACRGPGADPVRPVTPDRVRPRAIRQQADDCAAGLPR